LASAHKEMVHDKSYALAPMYTDFYWPLAGWFALTLSDAYETIPALHSALRGPIANFAEWSRPSARTYIEDLRFGRREDR
jgi:hypothetical protein